MGAFGIGQPLNRFEDERLLRGGGVYVADRALPGQAYACFLPSPHAHAAIETIELENARKAAGVISILECEMPATPVRVWQAINQQRRQAHA
jgi:carbon-monoxide dehydrogenase large subunit